MLNKLIIGTANFIKPYGILCESSALNTQEIHSIVKMATMHNINIYDTAVAYGDLLSVMPRDFNINQLQLITKFSVLGGGCQGFLGSLQKMQEQYNFNGYYAILIHDPHNLQSIDKKELIVFFKSLRDDYNINKIGVSVYDPKDVALFDSFFTPDIIQIPLNPMNQSFNDNQFLDYINKNNIEVHARSLFLQGVLLAEELPLALEGLRPLWQEFIKSIQPLQSRLAALLSWANMQDWVDKWVFGVSSLRDLTEILYSLKNIENINCSNIFENFKNIKHPLIDPRNWYLK